MSISTSPISTATAGGEEAEFTVTGLPPWMQWFGQNVPKDSARRQSRDASSGYWYPPAGGSYNPVVGIPDRPGDWTINVTARWPDSVEETVEIPVHVSCWGDYTYDESKDPVVTHFPIIACRVGQPLKNPFTNGDYVDVDLADVDCRSSLHPDTEETITVGGLPSWLTWDKSKRVTRKGNGLGGGYREDFSSYGWWYAPGGASYHPIYGTPNETGEWTVQIKASWRSGLSHTVKVLVRSIPESVFSTLAFDPNGGTVDTATAEGIYGDTIACLPTPTREGEWEFLGWYTEKRGGRKVSAGGSFPASMTLYAHWKSLNGPDILVPAEAYTAQKSAVLNGAVYDAEGKPAGLIQLKVAKPNAKKHTAKVSGSITLLDGKKRTFKSTTANVPTDAPFMVNIAVKGLGTLAVTIGKEGFGGAVAHYDVTSANVGGKWTSTGSRVYTGATDDPLPPGTLENLLPDGEPVRVTRGKWTFNKAASIKYAKGVLSGDKDPKKPNLSAMKLTYTPKTGLFKGSFKIYTLRGGKLKKYTVKVTGVVVGGEGTGIAKLAKPTVTWSVSVR